MPERHAASFRDPSGFVFTRDGVLLRQVQPSYREHYDKLIESGLYEELVSRGWMVAHQERGLELAASDGAYKVLEPEHLPFVSYPYEWCFGALRQAALLTLDIQALALDHGMTLKDASAYNLQLRGSKSLFIDTLSFEIRREDEPWIAYRQFCEHFVAPLLLMAKLDVRLGQLQRIHLDGIPLDLVSARLPRSSWLSPAVASHVHLHARMQQRHADAGRDAEAGKGDGRKPKVSERGLRGIIDSLRSLVAGLDWKLPKTEWGDYYSDTNYSDAARDAKHALVERYVSQIPPGLVIDLGANTGEFSRIASSAGRPTVAADVDPVAVERGFREASARDDELLSSLWMDLSNPSPGLGWAHRERESLADRGPAELVMALALVHHLGISNNVPLPDVARYLARLGRNAIIEFVPKSDSQVQRLLATREDVFPDYTVEGFERAVAPVFEIAANEAIGDSERRLYLLRRR